jgi:WD40 repeat protein
LPVLGWAQVAFLAALAAALAVITSEPAPHQGDAPAWAMRTGHPQGVQALAFAPDVRRLAIGGDDGAVVLWELGRGAERELPGDPAGAVLSLAFSPDGATLAAGDHGPTVTLWDVASGVKRATLRGHSGSVLCLTFSPDGRTLATGSDDQTVRVCDLASRGVAAILRGHRRPVRAVCFAPDGRTLASGCAGGQVKLWDLADGHVRERPGARIHNGPVRCLAFAPDGSIVASAGVNDRIKLWDTATGMARTSFGPGHDFVPGIAFAPDGRILMVAKDARIIQFWDVAAGRERAALRVESDALCVAFSRNSRFVATGVADGTVRVWDLAPSLAGASAASPRRTSWTDDASGSEYRAHRPDRRSPLAIHQTREGSGPGFVGLIRFIDARPWGQTESQVLVPSRPQITPAWGIQLCCSHRS